MALPMLLGAAARGIVKGGGRAAASKIMGRKKTVKPSAIAPKQKEQGQQQRKGGALVKSPTAAITKAMAPVKQISTGPAAKDDYLGIISEKLLIIEQIVLSVYQAELLNLMQKKQDDKDDARKEKENRLESKPSSPEKKKPTLDQLPKLGVFGWLKRFIGNIIAGIFLKKMVDFAGFLPGIIKFLDTVGNFLATFGVKLIDGLVTFVDFGIKAYDFTIGVIEKGIGPLFGENSSKVLGLIENAIFLTTAIAGSMAAEAMMGGGGGGGPTTGIRGAAGQAGRVAGAQTTTAAAARRYAARFGRDAAVQRFGSEAVKSLGGKYARSGITNFGRNVAVKVLGKRGAAKAIKGAAGILKPLVKNIPLIGGITEFILSWISGDPIGKAAFKGIGAGLGTWIGGALGTLIPVPGVGTAIGMFLGGTGGSALGSVIYDAIFKNKKPEPSAESVDNFYSEFQEGGKVAPRKKVKRGIDIKKKKQRKLRVPKPTRENLLSLPPTEVLQTQEVKNERAWWDFLGWAGTGGSPEKDKLGIGGKKLAEKVTDVGNKLGDDDYFGPILRITSKVILNQDVTARDYLNVGRGINLLLDDGMRKGAVGVTGYNEGGTVDNIPQLDVTGWVRKTFEDNLKDNIKKKYVKFASTSGPGTRAGQRDSATGELVPGTETGMVTALGSGGGSLKDMSEQDFSDLAFIVSHEALRGTDDEYAVAAAVLNRVADPRYPNTIMGVGTAPGQFEAVFSGKAYRDESLAKQLKDNQGKIVDALKKLDGRTDFKAFSSMGEFMGDTDIMFADNGNFYHYAEQRGKSDPIPSNIPQDWKKLLGESTGEQFTPPTAAPALGPAPTADASVDQADSPGALGSGAGAEGEEIAGKLGDFMKANRSKIGVTGSIHQWLPRHPGKFTRSYNSYHNVNRALDIGGWSPSSPEGGGADEQAPVIAALIEWNKKNGYNPVELIHGSPAYSSYGSYRKYPDSHHHHVHVAYKRGGYTLGKPHLATIGEEGTEFVTDADSTAALKQTAPGLMMALNQASDKSGIANVLKDYASYEQGAQQTVVMQDEGDEEQSQESYGGGSATPQLPPMIMGESSNPFEFLEYQG